MPHSHYDFFAAQAQHKKNSLMLYRLFAVVVVIHALILLAVCFIVAVVMTGDVRWTYFWTALAILGAYIFIGIAIQKYKLSQGGVSIAKQMGAVRLFIDKTGTGETEFFANFIWASNIQNLPSGYARFYEFAEQMSIASGVPLPLLYVLPSEMGINAFVAGFNDNDTVLVLTQGAIDTLDNESLYGLIAHQYSAIIHGDGQLNLTVDIMTKGLSWFYECGEWLETLLLGKFHSEYHGKEVIKNTPLTKDDWVRQWQQEYLSVNTRYHFRSYQNNDVDAQALAFSLSLPLFGALLAIRFLGLLGMASSDWIVEKFNKERSFLADATSIQLTRSFGVGQLLTYLQNRSTFLNNHNASHLGYFFFAPIRRQEEFFDTHPSINERLAKLKLKDYFVQSIEITKPLDKKELDKSHEFALKHAPIIALAQEILMETKHYTPAPKDTVVDGRLVVNQEWFDWSADEADNKNCENKKDTIITHNNGFDGIFSLENIKELQADWIITKHQRAVLGTLIFIESVQLMRFKTLPINHQFDLVDIYYKSVIDLEFKENLNCYPHNIGDDLLEAVAKLPRQADGCLTYLAIDKLNKHLNNPNIPLTDKQLKTLDFYYQKLESLLIIKDNNFEPVNNYSRLLAKIYKLYQGIVLALVLKTLGNQLNKPMNTKNLDEKLTDFNKYLPEFKNLTKSTQISLILLAFLVSVQDNSLLIGQTGKITASFGRLARLLGVAVDLDNLPIEFMQTTHAITVGEWAMLLLSLNADELNVNNLLETLHTACLYDVELAQKESDVLLLLKALLLKT